MNKGLEAIRLRSSVRSFDGRSLESAEAERLEAAFDACQTGPFGGRLRFMLVSAAALESPTEGAESPDRRSVSGKIGTYGLISRVPAFIVGAVERGPFAMEDFGYALEGLVLEATELGLGSCWIGGLFDRSAAATALKLGAGELLPAVLAIGRPALRMSLAERLTRRSSRAGTRRPFGELFFDQGPGRPQDSAALGPWAEVLEAVRRGPSASNKQPWRIIRVVAGASTFFHLYLEEDRVYNRALGDIHLQNIDMGIAMRHFEIAARALGLPGTWRRIEPDPLGLENPRNYISSWIVT